jgi:hypothetical protein
MTDASDNKERVYVIGDRGVGIFLIKINPLRVTEISDAEVTRYGKEHNCDGYANVGAMFWRVFAKRDPGEGAVTEANGKISGVESLIESGVKLAEVDFIFGANLDVDAIHIHKSIVRPIMTSLCHLTKTEGDDFKNTVISDEP